MNIQLLPILFSFIFCDLSKKFEEIDMAKQYSIKTSIPGAASTDPVIIRDITQKIPGLCVEFINDEESIVIKFNEQDDVLKQETKIIITPADETKPNLLTAKTYDDLVKYITLSSDNKTIVITLGPTVPEGLFVLTYNGQVDVQLTSDPTITTAQTYMFKSPLFVNQATPKTSTTNIAGFKLENFSASCKLLCEFVQTLKSLKDMFQCFEIPALEIDYLAKIFRAEKTRSKMTKCCSMKKVKPTIGPCSIIEGLDKISISEKCDIKQLCKPNVSLKQDLLSISICNAVAINTIFEFINFDCDNDDSFLKFAQSIIDIKTTITIEEAATILYYAIDSLADDNKCRQAYDSCLKDLNIDIGVMSRTCVSSSSGVYGAIKSGLSGVSLSTEVETTTAVAVEAEVTEEEEASSSDKPQSEGMSGKKKIAIVSAVVVVVVAVTVGAVVFFT